MSGVKSRLVREPEALVTPFKPTALIPESNVQKAVERLQTNLTAILDAQYLVAAATSALNAERVLTDTATIAWDFGTAAQGKANVVDASITLAKLANLAANKLIGRATASTGVPEAVGLDTSLEMSGGNLRRAAITGDATIAAGSNASVLATVNASPGSFGAAAKTLTATVNAKGLITALAETNIAITASQVSDFTEALQDAIGALFIDSTEIDWTYNDGANTLTQALITNSVVLGKLAQGTALSVLGVTGNAGANYADMVAGSDGHVMRRAGTAIGFGTVVAAGLASDAVTTVKILDANVTYAKIANGTGLSVIGRSANSGGVNADIVGVDGQVLRVSGTALGFGTIATAGHADASITYAKIQDVAGLSVIGRSANSSGVSAAITGVDGQVLRVSGTALGFGTIVAAGIASDAVTTVKILDANVTFAKIQNIAGLSVLGRSANSAGVGADITGVDGNVLRVSGTALGFGTIVAAGIASDAVTTVKILDANVTYAKIVNGTGLSVLGRSANSGGVNADIVGTDKQVLRVSGTSLGFGAIDLTSATAATGVLQAACAPVLSGAVINAGGTGTTTAVIALEVVIGNGSDVITTGVKGFLYCPFGFTITEATLVADASGSIVVDIWSDVYANGRPTVADTITASAKPTLSSANTSKDSTLTGWTTAVPAGNFLGFNVDSATTVKQVTLTLKATKTS